MHDSEDNTPGPSTIPSIVRPGEPLSESYTYHSPKPTSPGPYILGVDEAGRGPVLGPMVYGISYCPAAYKDTLEGLGFADSKKLDAAAREENLNVLGSDPANLAWSVRVLCPQAISSGMLRRPPVNLNVQSQQATVLLIKEVLDSGIELSEVYVDALGNTSTYQAYLSATFPGIQFTVEKKADDKYKVVSAASNAAKVTRDAWIEGWVFEESHEENSPKFDCSDMGSGYPSDPKTVAWIKRSMDPTFGFPSIARFSWTTIKVALDKEGHAVEWIDDDEQTSIAKSFQEPPTRDKHRCIVTKDLHIKSIGML